MRTIIFTGSKARYFLTPILILCFVLPFSNAQDQKEGNKTKGKPKKMHIKVITNRDDGEVYVLDTTLLSGFFTDSLMLKNLAKQLDLETMEKALEKMKIKLEIQMDSLDSFEKEITSTIFLDDLPEPPGEAGMFNFGDVDVDFMGDDFSFPGHQQMKLRKHRSPADNWSLNYTPWGKIKEIKVKDRRHGKKIVIKTQDAEGFPFFCPTAPPCPPFPPKAPLPPKKIKRIIIEKGDNDKDAEK